MIFVKKALIFQGGWDGHTPKETSLEYKKMLEPHGFEVTIVDNLDYLNDYEKLLRDMSRDDNPKILLGVTYALLDLAENYAPQLENTVVMETGGMKGRRKELPKSELHKILCSAFGVEKIHSEYGMAELMSQAYSFGEGLFRTPKWMRVLVRDVNNPFARLAAGRRGGLDIIDLANRSSCAFIATQDMGIRYEDGSFRIEGRISQSDVRGCNLLVQ